MCVSSIENIFGRFPWPQSSSYWKHTHTRTPAARSIYSCHVLYVQDMSLTLIYAFTARLYFNVCVRACAKSHTCSALLYSKTLYSIRLYRPNIGIHRSILKVAKQIDNCLYATCHRLFLRCISHFQEAKIMNDGSSLTLCVREYIYNYEVVACSMMTTSSAFNTWKLSPLKRGRALPTITWSRYDVIVNKG